MADQSGNNVLVAYKPEVTFNLPPSAAGAYRFRLNASSGLKLGRQTIASNEIRADGKTSLPRMGSRAIAGSYAADLSVGTFDPLLEAVLRGTWTATVAVTEATAGLTSVTTGANTIVASAGSFITAGFKVGDVFRAAGLPDAGNNGRNLRVTGVVALTLTVAETLIVNAAPDSSFTLTIARKLIQPLATPINRSFTFEEYYADVDLTEQFTGCRISSLRISMAPNGMCIAEFGIVGADSIPLATGTSPFYTSPVLTSSIALTALEAGVRFGGSAVVNLTAFEVNLDLGGSTLPVIGSAITPDVFLNNATLSGSISATRRDFTNLTRFVNETQLEFHALLVEPDSEPKDFISVFVPALILTDVGKSLGGDGAMIETLPFIAGTKGTATGYDDSMIAIHTSAA